MEIGLFIMDSSFSFLTAELNSALAFNSANILSCSTSSGVSYSILALFSTLLIILPSSQSPQVLGQPFSNGQSSCLVFSREDLLRSLYISQLMLIF